MHSHHASYVCDDSRQNEVCENQIDDAEQEQLKDKERWFVAIENGILEGMPIICHWKKR